MIDFDWLACDWYLIRQNIAVVLDQSSDDEE